MLVPYRRPKRPYVVPVVTALAVAAPLAAFVMSDSPRVRGANDSGVAAVPAQLAEVVLGQLPDIVLPLRELTGLNLPDLRLSDLRMLPLPTAIPVPPGLPLPPGIQLPSEIPLPRLNLPQPQQNPTMVAPTGVKPVPGITNSPNAPTVASQPPATAKIPVAQSISDPAQLPPGVTGDTPALAPGAVPADLLAKVGAQVKEISRDKPFSVVALTAPTLADTTALVRAKQADGAWGPWYNTDPVDTRRDDHTPADRTAGTEPIYVGKTNAVQVLVTRKQAVGRTPQRPLTDPVAPPPAAPIRTDDTAQTAAALKAVLIDPGRGAIDDTLTEVAGALPSGGPQVITRAQWGADEDIRCENPTYDDQLGGLTVHHTAGRNDYSKAESAGIVRAIYTYHAKTLGWCDIGYNALVDKYGQIFEGRYGGLDRPVQGAHAGGFNENTSGVALMGNHESEPPTEVALNAIGRFIGWRAKVAGLDPKGETTMWSEGTEFTPYPQGQAVKLPIVFAHRDVGSTACPGDAAYSLMDRIRDIAAGVAGSAGSKPAAPRADSGDPAPARPEPAPARPQQDLATLAALAAKLLDLAQNNAIAKHWADAGAASGPLGAPRSEILPAAQGQQYVKFVNGYAYTSPSGQVFEVVGSILDRFLQLGADAGVLGLPLSNSYPIPDGLRADFQYGSLILNQLTGAVSTVWKTYNDTYRREMQNPAPVAIPAGAAPQPIPAPAAQPGPVANEAPQPGQAPIPAN
ncbi:hypothetical protein D5S18_13010 [Nocardia panacis]|uniref:Cold-shock protein n=1 Tax=Nocardia panacis TaxID=2340916 RepID=A0A3A4L4N6_9NOCA|nr:N-acetylmuramoyl-L-alanine amidase [Nocardia panacis]RJO77303.1 hypothetical protein D5S18_13010 [Nocardia panacis]